jgi:hypothetical protein
MWQTNRGHREEVGWGVSVSCETHNEFLSHRSEHPHPPHPFSLSLVDHRAWRHEGASGSQRDASHRRTISDTFSLLRARKLSRAKLRLDLEKLKPCQRTLADEWSRSRSSTNFPKTSSHNQDIPLFLVGGRC